MRQSGKREEGRAAAYLVASVVALMQAYRLLHLELVCRYRTSTCYCQARPCLDVCECAASWYRGISLP